MCKLTNEKLQKEFELIFNLLVKLTCEVREELHKPRATHEINKKQTRKKVNEYDGMYLPI